MPDKNPTSPQAISAVTTFISRWETSGAAERANYQLFLSELCDCLAVPRPDPTVPIDARNQYVFERNVNFNNVDGSTSTGRIDLYKKGCFVLEAKQGSDQVVRSPQLLFPAPAVRRGTAIRGTLGWDEAMLAARGQAEQYAKALPVSEGWSPFLIVVDVGFSLELYADFSLTGKAYIPFPDSRNHRILLKALQETSIKDRLRAVWLDPLSLDPSRRAAEVTKEVATRLAALARDLESTFDAERVSGFLMRCIFTSFAENVKLLPDGGWTGLLKSLKEDVQKFPQMVSSLWQTMNEGGFSPILRDHILKFNGGLFESVEALPLEPRQLALLIEAAKSDWKEVEPAIFGTLLERALSPSERHRLGAHYTPRSYVERLVVPTIVEPLRYDWNSVQAAAVALQKTGKADEAIATVKKFHQQLCNTRILDPACGSGNFLYVSLEHLKRLEGEVLDTLHALGESQEALEHTGLTVDPHQLLGLEINPRAAHISDLVLWIGYLQWHFRMRGDSRPPEPVIKRFHNIEHRDALLQYSGTTPALDDDGQPITQWDGETKRTHPTTGEEIPDETARRPVLKYLNPKKVQWPKADFIIGNPPFIGPALMRASLGDGYVEAVRSTYDSVPDSADYVMYWWERAAELARAGKIRRFGFITTNSLPQVFNRRIVAAHLSASRNPLSIVYAVPDHPWVDAADGAAVRIAMTVGEKGEHDGLLCRVIGEQPGSGDGMQVELSELRGTIFADLKIGVDLSSAKPLNANERLSSRGVSLHGAGFIVTVEEADALGINRHPGLTEHIRGYRNGRDLTSKPRRVMVIDLFGMTSDQVRTQFPEVYQRVLDRVKPERNENNRVGYSQNWWIFGEPRANFRPALHGLHRYISTVETSKHRFFVFLDVDILPDNKLVNIALEDAFYLGVLSSHIHLAWVAGNQSLLENRPVYVKTTCFDPFPFPVCSEIQKAAIRSHAEDLDAHRKRQQELFPSLKMTDLYNVLEKLRASEPLEELEQEVYEEGLVAVLKEIHDRLDAAVADAYGWPANMANDEILQRVVILNAERVREEQNGTIRWLRPEYQRPQAVAVQTGLGISAELAPALVRAQKLQWPANLSEQVQLVKDSLRGNHMLAVDEVASRFIRARRTLVQEILETLTALGQIRRVKDRYVI